LSDVLTLRYAGLARFALQRLGQFLTESHGESVSHAANVMREWQQRMTPQTLVSSDFRLAGAQHY